MTTVYVLTADSGDSLAGDASLMTFSSGRSSPSERIYTTNLRQWRYPGDGRSRRFRTALPPSELFRQVRLSSELPPP